MEVNDLQYLQQYTRSSANQTESSEALYSTATIFKQSVIE